MSAQQYLDPPLTGGRVELRLVEPGSGGAKTPSAVYAARWSTPEGLWEGELIVREGGRIEATFQSEPAPAWLTDFSLQLLRTVGRTVTRTEAEGAHWPRRLTRWRAAPEER